MLANRGKTGNEAAIDGRDLARQCRFMSGARAVIASSRNAAVAGDPDPFGPLVPGVRAHLDPAALFQQGSVWLSVVLGT
jgi:hypothetical protein